MGEFVELSGDFVEGQIFLEEYTADDAIVEQ